MSVNSETVQIRTYFRRRPRYIDICILSNGKCKAYVDIINEWLECIEHQDFVRITQIERTYVELVEEEHPLSTYTRMINDAKCPIGILQSTLNNISDTSHGLNKGYEVLVGNMISSRSLILNMQEFDTYRIPNDPPFGRGYTVPSAMLSKEQLHACTEIAHESLNDVYLLSYKLPMNNKAKYLQLSNTRTWFILLENDNEILGFLQWELTEYTDDDPDIRFFIVEMIVNGKYQGKGLGSYLLKEAFALAVRLHCVRVDLCVQLANANAICMYHAKGFMPTKRSVNAISGLQHILIGAKVNDHSMLYPFYQLFSAHE